MEGDRLRTVGEVAEQLRLNPQTIRRWIASGRLRGVWLGTDRAGWRHPKLPSTIQVLDAKKLVIHTAPSVHHGISMTLDWFRNYADRAVVMNARAYEVDRATYDKDFAPLFVDPKDKSARRSVAKMTVPLLKKLKQQLRVKTGR